MAAQMLDLMYEHEGIGLAANQVDLPYRMFVCNVTGDPAKRDQEYVFINPVIRRSRGFDVDTEGCLSLPGLKAPVPRPKHVVFSAYTIDGGEFDQELDGLFARMVQHEIDHLDGVMFIDRLPPHLQEEMAPELRRFQQAFAQSRDAGETPLDEAIAKRLAELESLRT